MKIVTFFSTFEGWRAGANCWDWRPSRRFFSKLSSRLLFRISTMLSSLLRRPSSASTATLYRFRRTSVLALGLSDMSYALTASHWNNPKNWSCSDRDQPVVDGEGEQLKTLRNGLFWVFERERERDWERGFVYAHNWGLWFWFSFSFFWIFFFAEVFFGSYFFLVEIGNYNNRGLLFIIRRLFLARKTFFVQKRKVLFTCNYLLAFYLKKKRKLSWDFVFCFLFKYKKLQHIPRRVEWNIYNWECGLNWIWKLF